jgi:DNA-binding response OmpR family regulator
MKKLNVLILEDEMIIYQRITKILQNMGFINIFVTTNHTEALDLASKHRFHIMLSSVKIGDGYDGVDTVKVLQKLYDLAVIFICSYSDEEILSRVAEVNFIGYLIKPCREDELQTLISIAIKKSQFQQSLSYLKVLGQYRFDLDKNILYKQNHPITLTKKEQLFFSLFFHNLGVLIPYSVIDEIVWKNNSVNDNTRRTFLYRIKKRFPDLHFQTINNTGIILS